MLAISKVAVADFANLPTIQAILDNKRDAVAPNQGLTFAQTVGRNAIAATPAAFHAALVGRTTILAPLVTQALVLAVVRVIHAIKTQFGAIELPDCSVGIARSISVANAESRLRVLVTATITTGLTHTHVFGNRWRRISTTLAGGFTILRLQLAVFTPGKDIAVALSGRCNAITIVSVGVVNTAITRNRWWH